MLPPVYFEAIRKRASERWDQLESDPELAAPWHLLFKQVQSPRHVLSELLQNADDAGATEASVHISDGYFVFTHNGDDFVEDHFASLCRFGYSNKRALHTIGFRGVGFKSTFSLGGTVELYSPTLSVAFDHTRFTEPRWVDGASIDTETTQVRVAMRDSHCEREVEKNLSEWLQSPISLLFFEHLRSLRINGDELRWSAVGPGPVAGTDWMGLDADPDQRFLVARFEGEPFPDEALAEIRQERLLGEDSEAQFPPCRIEVVLGAKGRLYVVLPTGVLTGLPFACNAPFIQDPARLKIKDPEISPTNRWLLERTGSLTASLMMRWLRLTSASVSDRGGAYALLPDSHQDENSLDSLCTASVAEAFDSVIKDADILLTESAKLVSARRAIVIPTGLTGVWPVKQAASLLDSDGRSPFSSLVPAKERDKLVRRKLLDVISRAGVLQVLRESHLPRPQTWRGLLRLWAYVAPEITASRSYGRPSFDEIRILPVQGLDTLHAARDVVRLGERKLLQSEADWGFLATHLLVVNQNWLRFLADQRREAEAHDDRGLLVEIEAANAVFAAVRLAEASDVGRVIEQVACRFFAGEHLTVCDCANLGQIAAKLGATVGESFRFVTRDKLIRPVQHVVLFDADGALEELLPEDWRFAHLLHQDYAQSFTSCTADEWSRWVSSGRAGLLQLPPMLATESTIYGRDQIVKEVQRRGAAQTTYHYYPYVTNHFVIEDWDFEQRHWDHWIELAKGDPLLWSSIVERILTNPPPFWSKAGVAKVSQVATTWSRKSFGSDEKLLPSWILKLRELPCLPDTRGICQKPADLLRRTPETEPVMDVEAFLHGRLDTEANRPLLRLLGVREVPTGPDRLLDCLRALAKTENPPAHEVERWYRRLDQLTDACSTADLANIKMALRDERIVLTESHGWAFGSAVFLAVDEEDVPGAAIIRAAVRDLSIWRKIEVPERPTADLAIAWLNTLPSGKSLAREDAPRVRALLARHPGRIWSECGHWLNLEGEWTPVEELRFSLTLQGLVPWKHLHQWVKQQTADFQRLSADITGIHPFCHLEALGAHIEERFDGRRANLQPGSERVPWLVRIGQELCRVEFEDELETARTRTLAARLAETVWRSATGLEITPYIDGTPAGVPRSTEAVWLQDVLYVEALRTARLARVVPDVLGREFVKSDLVAALNYCFGRSPEEVTEYLALNFVLAPPDDGIAPSPEVVLSPDGPVFPPAPTLVSPLLIPGPPNPERPGENNGQTKIEPPVEPYAGLETKTSEDPEGADSPPAQPGTKSPATIAPPKPSIMERFALSMGFEKDGMDRFRHPDGRSLARAPAEPFPWQMRDWNGNTVHHYWAKDHCLERHPLEVPFEIWRWIDSSQKTHSLVLVDQRDEPVELEGTRLRALVDSKRVKLFQATYRLVYVYDNEQ